MHPGAPGRTIHMEVYVSGAPGMGKNTAVQDNTCLAGHTEHSSLFVQP